jgi:hypothetical protein
MEFNFLEKINNHRKKVEAFITNIDIEKRLLYLGYVVIGVLVLSSFGLLKAILWDRDILKLYASLPPIIFGTGVLIAILSFQREQDKIRKERIDQALEATRRYEKDEEERQRNTSKVFLERASIGFETVVDLLSNLNNDRVVWVHAARTLLESVDLGKEIKSPDYQKAFQLKVNLTRAKLHQTLTQEDSQGKKSPLPPHFFFGGKDWRQEWARKMKLEHLAIKHSDPLEAYSLNIDELPPTPQLNPISEKSITAIYDFMEYPEDFQDLHREIEAWEGNWDVPTKIDCRGARRFVAFQQGNITFDKKVTPRNKAKEG